jgi:hypothetical protein
MKRDLLAHLVADSVRLCRDLQLAELLAHARWSRRSAWSWLGQVQRSHPLTLRRMAAVYDLRARTANHPEG